MSPELIGILGVGVALLSVNIGLTALLTASIRRVDNRVAALEIRMDDRFEHSENRIDRRFERMDERFVAMDARMSNLEKGQARIEGLSQARVEDLLDALRESLSERAGSSN